MNIVREYRSACAFEAGIDIERSKGWLLYTWNMVATGSGITIVAVFISR